MLIDSHGQRYLHPALPAETRRRKKLNSDLTVILSGLTDQGYANLTKVTASRTNCDNTIHKPIMHGLLWKTNGYLTDQEI
jgi:hypothetical protein